eukprot:gene313-337_t
MKVSGSLLDLIGRSPLIRLSKRIYDGPGTIYALAEYLSPGGSIKDRAALQIIEDAYKQGKLKQGQPVIEMTSGNMGAGLAVVCAIYGNPFYAVMSSGNSAERRKILEGLGAKVILVPQVDGTPGKVTGKDIQAATEEAIVLSQRYQGFYCDQFNNLSSIIAHQRTTGPEIYSKLQGNIHGFVAAVGSGGTFLGTSGYLKSKDSKIHCVAVEPFGAEVLGRKPVVKPQHIIQGIGYGFVPPHWDPSLADDVYAVCDDEVADMRKRLGEKEGIFVGFSAAANVVASIKLLSSGALLSEDPVVATILCDHGLKY